MGLDFYCFSIYTSRFCIRIVNNSVKIVSDKLKAKESQNTKLCHTDDDTDGPVLQLRNISQFSLTLPLLGPLPSQLVITLALMTEQRGKLLHPRPNCPSFFNG